MTLHHAPTLFDRFFADLEAPVVPRAHAARPAVDLVAYEDRIELHADLPGLTEKDIVDVIVENEAHADIRRLEADWEDNGQAIVRAWPGTAQWGAEYEYVVSANMTGTTPDQMAAIESKCSVKYLCKVSSAVFEGESVSKDRVGQAG